MPDQTNGGFERSELTTSQVVPSEDTSHPLSVGLGAVLAGGATGATAGALAGPVGSVVGSVLGAIAGGLGGHVLADLIDPAEDQPVVENYTNRVHLGRADSDEPASLPADSQESERQEVIIPDSRDSQERREQLPPPMLEQARAHSD